MPQQDRHEAEKNSPRNYPAEKARGGRIILNTPARRLVFFGGLIALVVFIIIARLSMF